MRLTVACVLFESGTAGRSGTERHEGGPAGRLSGARRVPKPAQRQPPSSQQRHDDLSGPDQPAASVEIPNTARPTHEVGGAAAAAKSKPTTMPAFATLRTGSPIVPRRKIAPVPTTASVARSRNHAARKATANDRFGIKDRVSFGLPPTFA